MQNWRRHGLSIRYWWYIRCLCWQSVPQITKWKGSHVLLPSTRGKNDTPLSASVQCLMMITSYTMTSICPSSLDRLPRRNTCIWSTILPICLYGVEALLEVVTDPTIRRAFRPTHNIYIYLIIHLQTRYGAAPFSFLFAILPQLYHMMIKSYFHDGQHS